MKNTIFAGKNSEMVLKHRVNFKHIPTVNFMFISNYFIIYFKFRLYYFNLELYVSNHNYNLLFESKFENILIDCFLLALLKIYNIIVKCKHILINMIFC
jgi:hypothetical protein